MTVNFIYIGNPPYEDVYTPILSKIFPLAQSYFIIILFLQSKQKYGISKLNTQSSK